MVDRNVTVKVRADVADFLRGAGLVEGATRKMADGAKAANDEAKRGLSGMAQHVRDNQQAYTTTGAALTAYGAAVTGLGVIVTKTGIDYNTLRQRSVAALTTLTGSAEDANAQMDRLDEFATNSPFARDVFIRAQQQLMGFGFEAEKVVPILDAVQNAVAATGGSNQDIAELVRIIAQIGASAKITAVDLREFGNRGVDAATIIGEQMGLTGAEIREKITAGTLDADAAIAALTAGMDQRFGGAAENVKGTMLGAVDRVKAAFRDISASFASVLVDPQGGGLLVDGLNSLADAMRAFEDLPTPIRNTGIALGLITGPLALAAGGFLLLAPRAVETWDALGRMGRVGDTAKGALRNVGRAAALAAGPAMLGLLLATLSKVGQGMLDTKESANELENRLRQMSSGESIDALILGADGIDDFNAALQGIADPSLWGRIDNGVDDFFNGIFTVITAGHDGREAIDQFRQSLPALDDALSQMAVSSLPDATQGFRDIADAWNLSDDGMLALLDTMPGFRDHLVGVANDMGIAADDATILALATGEIKPPADDAAGAIEGMADATEDLNGAFVKVDPSIMAEKVAQIRQHNVDILQSFVDLSADIGNQEISLDAWWQQIEDQFAAQAAFIDNIAYLRGQGMNEAFIQGLIEQGPAGAMRTQQIVDAMTGGEAAKEEWLSRGEEYAAALDTGVRSAIDETDPVQIKWELQQEAGRAAEAKAELESIFYGSEPAQIPVDADTAPATARVDEWQTDADSRTGTTTLDTYTNPATGKLESFLTTADNSTGTATLDADGGPAERERSSWAQLADDTLAMATLAADSGPADAATFRWERDADNASGTATVYADTGPAYRALGGLLSSIRSSAASISIGLGYAGGGFTGPGAVHEPAGEVHRGEFVHTQAHTRRPGMLAFHTDLWQTNDLDGAYRRHKLRGYADGGPVGGSAPFVPAPQVTVAPMSLDGMHITGTLDLGGGLTGFVDGRIRASDDHKRYAGRL